MKRLVLLLSLLAAPAAAQQVSIPHTTFTLPNGLRVIVAEDHSAPLAAVNVWYHVGSGYERPGRTGLRPPLRAHHVRGEQERSRGRLRQLARGRGRPQQRQHHHDRTNYYEVMPSNAVELALWLEADRMGGLLDAMRPQQARGPARRGEERAAAELREPAVRPAVGGRAAPAVPEGHPYSWTTIGSMADLDAAQLEDVNQFFRTYYAPNNASIAIVGDVNPAQVRQWVERYFGWIPRGADGAAAHASRSRRWRPPPTPPARTASRCPS